MAGPNVIVAAFLRRNYEMVDSLVTFVNAQQKANRIVIERLTGTHYPARAYRTEDVVQAVERVGGDALLIPLQTLARQRNDILQLFGYILSDDAETGEAEWVDHD